MSAVLTTLNTEMSSFEAKIAKVSFWISLRDFRRAHSWVFYEFFSQSSITFTDLAKKTVFLFVSDRWKKNVT